MLLLSCGKKFTAVVSEFVAACVSVAKEGELAAGGGVATNIDFWLCAVGSGIFRNLSRKSGVGGAGLESFF